MKFKYIAILLLLIAAGLSAQNVSQVTAKTVDGDRFQMKEQLESGPVIIAFWATWCKPCRKELPAIREIYDEYKDSGLSVVAISIDSPRSLSKVKSYVKKSGLPYKFLLDPSGEISNKLMVRDVPHTLLADQSGEVIYSHRGYNEGDEQKLAEKVSELFSGE